MNARYSSIVIMKDLPWPPIYITNDTFPETKGSNMTYCHASVAGEKTDNRHSSSEEELQFAV